MAFRIFISHDVDSDGHIAKFDHGGGSGYWTKTGPNSYLSDVVLFNYDDPLGGGSDSVVSVSVKL